MIRDYLRVHRTASRKRILVKPLTIVSSFFPAFGEGLFLALFLPLFLSGFHTNRPVSFPNELIANFVGEVLFTEDGSGLRSMISDMEVKERSKFVQFFRDFFEYIKKKLSGQKVTQEVVRLERMFNEVLSTVEGKVDESFSLVGETSDGIEVYETSEDLNGLSYIEKINVFRQNFYDENSPHYLGKKFVFS